MKKCQVMGILNLTPDSFSDGGLFTSLDKAVKRAFQMKEEGADLIDVGAESTRPGAESVEEKTERNRLFPVLKELKNRNFPIPISLDTSKPSLADEALSEGLVSMVNDVEGLRNPKMADVIRKWKVPVVLMHMFGSPRTMQNDFHYGDIVSDLIRFFKGRILESGLQNDQIILDPGIGFGKSVEHNLQILKRLRELGDLGYPILIGASRKSFIGKILNLPNPLDRVEGSLACALLAVQNGASYVRVHDVLPSVLALQMVEAISQA
jgi:dihydropteroate synthase